MRRITSNFQWYFKIVIVFTIINLFSRIFDFSLILLHQPEGLMSYFDLLKAMAFDFMLSLAFAGLFFVFFIIFSLINKYLARTLSVLFFILVNILNIGLILYFDYTKVPLDQVVFVYKLKSLIDIVQLSGGTNLSSIFPIIIGIVIFLVAYILILKAKFPNFIVNTALFIMVFAAASTNLYIQKPSAFPSEQSYYCNQNKIIYFVKKSIYYYNSMKEIDLNIGESKIKNYQNTDPQHKVYEYVQFPFCHLIEPNSNLAKYFRDLPNGEKPNIVFIIVESLCHDLSGKDSPNYSFTPFLDSLTQQSLYWRNALSSSERTFGVLPTVLASLPPGKTGFMDEYKNFPNFCALPKSLKANDYSTQMFYGGWLGFTDMDKFVYKSGIDSTYNNWPGSIKMPEVENKFTWGYGDEVIFDKSFDYLNTVKSPYFNLYLTLSSHSPFSINNQEKYMDRVKEMLNDINNKSTRNYVSKHIKEISTFIMFDEQLQLFFEKYRSRADFQKTIFVITGDHKSMLFPIRNNLDKYHVPLIIYSPLLKQSKEFGALVSHFDITPAISKLLSVKYQLQMPVYSQYLGNDLDTNTNFVSNQRLFFMRNSRVVDEYLYKNTFIAGDRLFKVNDLMQLTPINDDALRDKMKKELDDYMKIQIFSINSNILIK